MSTCAKYLFREKFLLMLASFQFWINFVFFPTSEPTLQGPNKAETWSPLKSSARLRQQSSIWMRSVTKFTSEFINLSSLSSNWTAKDGSQRSSRKAISLRHSTEGSPGSTLTASARSLQVLRRFIWLCFVAQAAAQVAAQMPKQLDSLMYFSAMFIFRIPLH